MLMLFVAVSLNLYGATTNAPRNPKLRSAAAVVQDQRTGELLFAKHAETAMPIASLTKLMTAMVVLDARLDMDAVITIEEADKDTLRHSQSHLYVGTKLSRSEALILALMASENRAAHALARSFPGGVGAIVSAMNEKARALALTETRFEDPTGLSEGNISSAKDLSRLVDKAFQYHQICSSSTQIEFTLQQGKKKLRFVNTNTLLRNHKWSIGLSKTGYIEPAGRCLVMQTVLAQRPVIIVLLNSTGANTRQADALRIKQWLENSNSSQKTKK
jgi:serine-type D-Ala-D-Ala endopeptidase (penicillin-binding protein 7)